MGNDALENRKDVNGLDRRTFLTTLNTLGKFAAVITLFVPVLRFINFNPPKKPKFVKVSRPLKADGFIIEQDFILFDISGGPIAVSRTCTHLGCKLNYHEIEKMLICPCHRSRFSRKGERLAGPAQLDLPTFEVEEVGAEKVDGYVVAVV